MILAAHDILAATAESDRSGTVAADVAEGAEGSLLVANDEQRFSGAFGGKKRFWVGDGFLYAVDLTAGMVESADELPGAAKDFVLLDFEDGRIGVKARGEGVGAFDLLVDVEMEGLGGHGSEFLIVSGVEASARVTGDGVQSTKV